MNIEEQIEDENIRASTATVTIATIHQMTMDSFEFWLNYDLPRFDGKNGIRIAWPCPEMGVPQWKQYVRAILIRWSINDPDHFNRTAIVSWAQIHTDNLRVEIKSEGEMYDILIRWLKERLEITDFKKGGPTLDDDLNRALTPTEKKVARLLAQKMTYAEIGQQLGNRSEHAGRKHAQNLARKWGTRQYIEELWSEAQKRGFDTP